MAQSTVEKLTTWYLRTLVERGRTTTGTTARAALAVLLDFLPEREREAMVREFRRALEKQAKAAGCRFLIGWRSWESDRTEGAHGNGSDSLRLLLK